MHVRSLLNVDQPAPTIIAHIRRPVLLEYPYPGNNRCPTLRLLTQVPVSRGYYLAILIGLPGPVLLG